MLRSDPSTYLFLFGLSSVRYNYLDRLTDVFKSGDAVDHYTDVSFPVPPSEAQEDRVTAAAIIKAANISFEIFFIAGYPFNFLLALLYM